MRERNSPNGIITAHFCLTTAADDDCDDDVPFNCAAFLSLAVFIVAAVAILLAFVSVSTNRPSVNIIHYFYFAHAIAVADFIFTQKRRDAIRV